MSIQLYHSSSTILIEQDVLKYDRPVSDSNKYDFVINIPVTANTLFATKTYVQNSQDPNQVNFDLTLNQSYLNTVLDSTLFSKLDSQEYNFSTSGSDNKYNDTAKQVFTTVDSSLLSISRRFLEIAAIKIFGSAHATAAIRNDSEFLSGANSVVARISGGIMADDLHMSDATKLDVFNAYVNSGKYVPSNDDVDTKTFNFHNTHWEFPVNMIGKVKDSDGGIMTVESSYGRNYADGFGVLLRFTDV